MFLSCGNYIKLPRKSLLNDTDIDDILESIYSSIMSNIQQPLLIQY